MTNSPLWWTYLAVVFVHQLPDLSDVSFWIKFTKHFLYKWDMKFKASSDLICNLIWPQTASTHLLAFSRNSGALKTTHWESLCWTPKMCYDEHFDFACACLSSFILEKFKCKKVENVDVKDTILLISLDYKTKQASILTFMCLTLQSQK